jgi:hypothetical protein
VSPPVMSSESPSLSPSIPPASPPPPEIVVTAPPETTPPEPMGTPRVAELSVPGAPSVAALSGGSSWETLSSDHPRSTERRARPGTGSRY